MNWFDKAVAAIDPMAGVKRAQARLALDQVRMYEAAKLGRRTDGWQAGSGSANAEIAPSLSRVRNRCRQMIRDNEYASRILDGLVANTVGTGIIAKVPGGEAEQQMWDRWTQYSDADGQLDFNGQIELAHRTRREVGEVLVRIRMRDPDVGFEVPMQLQVLEPDHLDETKTGTLANGNFAICGVEFNPIGQRIAYWLYPTHPGEVASYRRSSFESKRVPASEVLHYYRKRRASQVRGISEFGTGLLRLRDLADYEMAELVRKKIEACFVAFVKTDSESTQLGQVTDKGPPRGEKMNPGMIKYLSNAESVTFGSPSNAGGAGEHVISQVRAFAAGAGGTYEMATGDYSQMNFSGGKLSYNALRPLIEQEQWLALVPMLLNPVASRYQQTARLAGKRSALPQLFGWTMPRVQMGDLLKEALGIKELVKGGLLSLPEAIRELGYDPDVVLKQNKDYRRLLTEAGVLVDTDPVVAMKLIDPAAASKIIESLLKD